jgi:hypothetical protein
MRAEEVGGQPIVESPPIRQRYTELSEIEMENTIL